MRFNSAPRPKNRPFPLGFLLRPVTHWHLPSAGISENTATAQVPDPREETLRLQLEEEKSRCPSHPTPTPGQPRGAGPAGGPKPAGRGARPCSRARQGPGRGQPVCCCHLEDARSKTSAVPLSPPAQPLLLRLRSCRPAALQNPLSTPSERRARQVCQLCTAERFWAGDKLPARPGRVPESGGPRSGWATCRPCLKNRNHRKTTS